MNSHLESVAAACLHGAETDTMTFPQIVGILIDQGFESYTVDFRRGNAVYYMPDGDNVVIPTHERGGPIAAMLDKEAIQDAILEAQQLVPGYSYAGFCTKVMTAGCAGYIVSFSGRRAVYFGRTAETHVEHFPQ